MKNNMLIAEFMGAKVKKGFLGYNLYYGEQRVLKWNTNTEKLLWETLSESKYYHDSWEWLMPVVDKLKSTEEIEVEELDDLKYSLWYGDLEQVYSSVLEVIKEYNLNKVV